MMMSLMSKLLISTIAATVTLSANISDKDLIDFFKGFVIKSHSTKVSSVDTHEVKKVDGHPAWEAYKVTMNAKKGDKDLPVKMTIFANNNLMTSILVDSNKGIDYTGRVTTKVGSLYKDSKNKKVDEAVITKYMENFYLKAPYNEQVSTKLIDTQSIKGHPNWKAYLAIVSFKNEGQDVSLPKTIFSDGNLITSELVDYSKKIDYSRDIKPKLSPEIYNRAHLLFGNKDAKHKIVVFSDPQCPFCMDLVPKIMKAAKENPETIALYYYHLPLVRIHPVSGILVRIMHVAQELGRSDIVKKIYAMQINVQETNIDRIIDAVKKQTGFTVTRGQIESKATINAIKTDEKSANELMVSGTPTVYVDGVWDKKRDKYKSLIPAK